MSQYLHNSVLRGVTTSTGRIEADITVPTYTVATAPANAPAGSIAYISNGAAGDPILAFSNGTAYLRSDTGGALAS